MEENRQQVQGKKSGKDGKGSLPATFRIETSMGERGRKSFGIR